SAGSAGSAGVLRLRGRVASRLVRFAQDDKGLLKRTRDQGEMCMGKNRGMEIRNCKRRGEWAEMVFAGRALREGLRLARPWGESSGYDFVVDQDGKMVRVQVKSTIFKEGTGYSCSMKDSKGPYKKGSFEFVAAYVIPEDVWFIIPEKKVRGLWSVGLYPKLEGSKYGEYLEAWDLLRGDGPVVIDRIEACVEDQLFLE
ncbi:MAG: group I intron-associated PD-(D/E)XK endonuclease, partial [Candidatus Sulfotelmatobacter sp.]